MTNAKTLNSAMHRQAISNILDAPSLKEQRDRFKARYDAATAMIDWVAIQRGALSDTITSLIRDMHRSNVFNSESELLKSFEKHTISDLKRAQINILEELSQPQCEGARRQELIKNAAGLSILIEEWPIILKPLAKAIENNKRCGLTVMSPTVTPEDELLQAVSRYSNLIETGNIWKELGKQHQALVTQQRSFGQSAIE